MQSVRGLHLLLFGLTIAIDNRQQYHRKNREQNDSPTDLCPQR